MIDKIFQQAHRIEVCALVCSYHAWLSLLKQCVCDVLNDEVHVHTHSIEIGKGYSVSSNICVVSIHTAYVHIFGDALRARTDFHK
jgi:hypothetical protein